MIELKSLDSKSCMKPAPRVGEAEGVRRVRANLENDLFYLTAVS